MRESSPATMHGSPPSRGRRDSQSFPSFLCGSVGKFGLLHALRLTRPPFSLYLHVFGYSRSRRSPRERKCEKGLLLTDQSNRIKLSFVAPPQGCQSTVRHAQLVP